MTFLGGAQSHENDDGEVAGLGQAGRIARIFRLPRHAAVTDLEMDETISRGLPIKAYDALIEAVRGSDAEWQPPIVSIATYQRAKRDSKRRLKPEASAQVYEFARVVDGARLVFGKDRDAIQRFFLTPNVVLKGRRPFDVAMSSPAGGDAVLRVLNEARAGVAV